MNSLIRIQDYPLLAGLSEEELAQLSSCFVKRTFGKGAYIFYPGSPCLNLYLIESGMVRLFFADARGQEYMVNLVGPPSTVGLPLLPENDVRLIGAAAQQETVTLVLSRGDLFAFARLSPQFMQNIYTDLVITSRKLTFYAQAQTILRLEERLASFLFYQASRSESRETREIQLSLTQAEVASWVGGSRGRINRALSKMQQAALIRLDGQKILIIDLQGLAKMAERLMTHQV